MKKTGKEKKKKRENEGINEKKEFWRKKELVKEGMSEKEKNKRKTQFKCNWWKIWKEGKSKLSTLKRRKGNKLEYSMERMKKKINKIYKERNVEKINRWKERKKKEQSNI